jgi:hypothetical protein
MRAMVENQELLKKFPVIGISGRSQIIRETRRLMPLANARGLFGEPQTEAVFVIMMNMQRIFQV